jgi:arginyl-tRNA synthetase
VLILRERFARAIARAFPEAFPAGGPEPDPLIVASKQQDLADFQCNAAMGLGKRLGMQPREAATFIVKHADVSDVCEALGEKAIAGPGFINLRLRADALARGLVALDEPHLGVAPAQQPMTIVVDLMGVNLAKQMHVGHLRSPIIGDAIARGFERLGHRVLRQNHVGDWGLNIAMTTARVMRLAREGTLEIDALTLDQLDKAYAAAQAECQRDISGLAAARHWSMGPKAMAELEAQVDGATDAFGAARATLVKLQQKDPATLAVWRRIYDVTMRVCLEVCAMLNVKVSDADSAGESSYADELAPMLADLVSRGIAVEDQGALIIRLDRPPQGEEAIKEPCLVRKSDGGYLYATTDIAAVRRRVQKLGAERVIYAVDARQSLHLRQVFLASKIAGYATIPDGAGRGTFARFDHAAFGSVMGEDGRPFKTRTGDVVRLADLIRETFDRAREAVTKRDASIPEDEAREIARCVGIAALKYADLSTDKAKDYVFSFDRMLAFEGDTGPYLLNALVRIRSIFRKAREKGVTLTAGAFTIREAKEKSLALVLLRYPGALTSSVTSIEPHKLCQYLFELAGAFASFYEACPVLAASDDATRDARLRLCSLTARVLEDGLATLGIPALERM